MSTFRHNGKMFHRTVSSSLFICIVILGWCVPTTAAQNPRWTENQARAWQSKQPWLVGANYIPSDSINQFEMWQAASFNADDGVVFPWPFVWGYAQAAQKLFQVPEVVVRVLDPARAQFYATKGLRIVCPTSAAIETLVSAVRHAEEEVPA